MWLLNVFKGNNMPVMNVPVAQLDRVLASDAKGCEFEPRRIRQNKKTIVKIVFYFASILRGEN